MKNLVTKVKNYINQKYLKKYLDNRYWSLTENYEGKVTALLHEQAINEITKYNPGIDLEAYKTNVAHYDFLLHNFTRYIYKITDCTIDPDYNWVMLGDKQLFSFSFPLINDPWGGIKPRPSVLGNIFKKKTTHLDKAILVKYNWSSYYHFFIDTLAQLALVDRQGIPADIPIIVPYTFRQYQFVQDYFREFPLQRKVIIQEKGQYTTVKELYVAKDLMCNDNYALVRNNIIKNNIASKAGNIDSPERIFITRKKGLRRGVTNIAELEQIVKQYGFTVVDPGGYSWLQQVKLFNNAKCIIGIHGGGMTNILFCKNDDLRILELFPGNNLHPPHYEQMAIKLGYQYSSIEGDGLDVQQQFTIDRELFIGALKKLIG